MERLELGADRGSGEWRVLRGVREFLSLFAVRCVWQWLQKICTLFCAAF